MRAAVGGAAAGAALVLTGCGGGRPAERTAPLDPSIRPIPLGPGPRYTLPPRSRAVARAARVGRLSCGRERGAGAAAHVELFADGYVVRVPAGIGIAPPVRRDGPYVRRGRCAYPLRTHEPTGLVRLDRGVRFRLGELFALWGQPLTPRRLAGFRGRVGLWIGGRAWRGDPRDAPLRRHEVVVLQVGRRLPPHRTYAFPPGT